MHNTIHYGTHDHFDKQRLKEAIWRIQGLSRQGRVSLRRLEIIDSELALIAKALRVSE